MTVTAAWAAALFNKRRVLDSILVISLLVLGAGIGLAAGLLGIGGGMILVPFLTFLLPLFGVPQELAVHASIATAMATILFTSLSSVRAHHKHGAIRWDVVKVMVPGLLVGGLVSGGAIFALIDTALPWPLCSAFSCCIRHPKWRASPRRCRAALYLLRSGLQRWGP